MTSRMYDMSADEQIETFRSIADKGYETSSQEKIRKTTDLKAQGTNTKTMFVLKYSKTIIRGNADHNAIACADWTSIFPRVPKK